MSSKGEIRIGCLDGLRGLAALWVLVGHAHLLTGFDFPVIGDPDLGVDLFIVLSGFLMVFHYQLKQSREPWEDRSTWYAFWIRRFFRIAPLYYVMLVVALSLGQYIYDARVVIDVFRGVEPQRAIRYIDSSFSNYVTHLSFVFGLFPSYAFRTPLPDWSVGLEMQFYAALPFLMIVIGRIGWTKGILLIVAASLAAALCVRVTDVGFPMPSFLPLKMHVFAAGMLLAGALRMTPRQAYFTGALAVIFVLIPIGGRSSVLHEGVRLGLVAMFFSLIHVDRLPAVLATFVRPIGNFLSIRFCRNLGELSFGAYLIHLLVMQPVVAAIIQNLPMAAPLRWALTLIVTIPIVYGVAFLGYLLIELPGQRIGRNLSAPKVVSASPSPPP